MEMLRLRGVGKSFTLHNQNGQLLEVLRGVDLSLAAGECVALVAPSGSGKSTLLRLIYGNYLCRDGDILVRRDAEMVDIASASPRTVLDLRGDTIGYVSQFLRVIPRVPTIDIVAEPLLLAGHEPTAARAAAGAMLTRLAIPERLFGLAPQTFSGGEQQRVNVARGFIRRFPLLLLDEPTASLDAANRDTVMRLIQEAKAAGSAILGIFHDEAVRDAVADRTIDLAAFQVAA